MIIGVAIKKDNKIWMLTKPNRHHHVIRHMILSGEDPKNGIQGFFTDTGQFLDRLEACKYAIENDQIKNKIISSRLISEELW